MFSRLGESWFDDYWINYRKIQLRQSNGSYQPISNLHDFVIYRQGDPRLIVIKNNSNSE